jgi:uncharacterized membrane protein
LTDDGEIGLVFGPILFFILFAIICLTFFILNPATFWERLATIVFGAVLGIVVDCVIFFILFWFGVKN